VHLTEIAPKKESVGSKIGPKIDIFRGCAFFHTIEFYHCKTTLCDVQRGRRSDKKRSPRRVKNNVDEKIANISENDRKWVPKGVPKSRQDRQKSEKNDIQKVIENDTKTVQKTCTGVTGSCTIKETILELLYLPTYLSTHLCFHLD